MLENQCLGLVVCDIAATTRLQLRSRLECIASSKACCTTYAAARRIGTVRQRDLTSPSVRPTSRPVNPMAVHPYYQLVLEGETSHHLTLRVSPTNKHHHLTRHINRHANTISLPATRHSWAVSPTAVAPPPAPSHRPPRRMRVKGDPMQGPEQHRVSLAWPQSPLHCSQARRATGRNLNVIGCRAWIIPAQAAEFLRFYKAPNGELLSSSASVAASVHIRPLRPTR